MGDLTFHPLAELFPLIEGDNFDELVADIRANGLQEPIVLLEGEILDGRNRYRALQLLDQPHTSKYFVDYYDFPSVSRPKTSPLEWVLSKNLHRRHLTESQRSLVAGKLESLRHGGSRKGDPQDANLHLDRRQVAKTLNVSPRSVASAAKVIAQGAPELQKAVENGTVAVSLAAEMAKLPKPEQVEIVARGKDEIKKAAKEIRKAETDERRVERFANIKKIAEASVPLPTGAKFPVIYADPPWRFESGFSDRSIENHYPTMTLDEICEMPVGDLATKDAVLFMWVTVPHLINARRVLDAWGFEYKSHAMWDKQITGTGYWFFNQHEILIVATRGSFPAPDPLDKARSVYSEERGKHSAKPEYYYDLIERMTPDMPRIELFARSPRRGWSVWGNQSQALPETAEKASPHENPRPAESGELAGTDPETLTSPGCKIDGESHNRNVTLAGGEQPAASFISRLSESLAIPSFLKRGHVDCKIQTDDAA